MIKFLRSVVCLLSLTSSNIQLYSVNAEESNEIRDSTTSNTFSSHKPSESTSYGIDTWSFDLIEYSLSNTNLFLTYIYDFYINYLNSMTETFKILYHYTMARCFAMFFPVKTVAIQPSQDNVRGDDYKVMTPFSGSTITHYLYLLQNLLFRMDTVVILLIFFTISFIIHRRNVIEMPGHVHQPYSLDWMLTKMFRFLNFTVVFSQLFTVVDSTLKSYFHTQTIVNQAHSGSAGAYSMQGRRPNMEDTFSLRNNISQGLGIEYYAVFDGHGGQNAALHAEKEIFERISKKIEEVLSKADNEQCSKTTTLSTSNTDSCPATTSKKSLNKFDSLTLTLMKNMINEEIINMDERLVETFEKKSDISGSTALIAIRLINSNKLLVANVGDSRGILCDSKGATIPLSFDHKPYQLKEYRRILEAGGYISLKGVYRVNGILAISRALGDYPLKDNRLIIPDPDILTFDLDELNPKFMIMATDGFWDTFSNENAVQFVHNELARINRNQTIDPSLVALQIAKKLAKEAYIRESYDNITVIVVLFDDNSKRPVIAKTTRKSSPIRKSSSNLNES